MKIGYARVSKYEQTLDLQIDALKKEGCEKIFTDKIAAIKSERRGLSKAESILRKGDVLVIWKLDRLGRSMSHLVNYLNVLNEKNIGLKICTLDLNTHSPTGKMLYYMSAIYAEFERDLIRERTLAGLAAARARGRVGGRKKKLNAKQVKLLKQMHADKSYSISDILGTFKIGKTAMYRYLDA